MMEPRKEANSMKRGHEEGCRVTELGKEEGSIAAHYTGRATRRVLKNTVVCLGI